MKIVVLGTRGFPEVQGGVEKHCEELYPRLVNLGCDITVFTRTPYISEENRVSSWKGIKFIHLWCPRKKSLEAIIHTLLGTLRTKRLSPDILHIHAIGPSLLTPLAKLSGLRVVMTHHGPDYERAKWGKLAKIMLKKGEKFGVLYSDTVIAISKRIKEFIKNRYGKNPVFIPNGVNIPTIIPPGNVLDRWQLRPKEYIFTACRFVPEKGLHDLINAYRSIKNPSFKMVIAGDADHETEYSKRLKKLASETEGVVLTGFVYGKKLGELFSNAGLFVLPSYYEGLPIVLLEALSYGLPVLASDIPANREISLPEFRYFKAKDVEELSSKIVKAMENGIPTEEKEKNFKFLKETFNWDIIANNTKKIYERVLKKL